VIKSIAFYENKNSLWKQLLVKIVEVNESIGIQAERETKCDFKEIQAVRSSLWGFPLAVIESVALGPLCGIQLSDPKCSLMVTECYVLN